MLELHEIVKHYRIGESEPVHAVDGVSLKVRKGELVALYGPSGSGKSTLLLLIAALLRPDSGSIVLDGHEISALSDQKAARYRLRELGFVRQTLNLTPGVSAVDNAALKLMGMGVRAREAREQVTPLMDTLGLEDRLHHRSDQLSMGERQRVMIARALSTDPKLVLADEPTGSLDSRRGQEVLELLAGVCRQRELTVVLVTHDPQAASYADRVLTLRDGQLRDDEPEPRLVSVDAS
ncbi:MAG TPA: ABC transporter ATP-binding protein [Solirubrobacteraceae bacterium]